MNLAEQVQKLTEVKAQLPKGDWDFASDLVKSYKKYGDLTPKQYPWVGRLLAKAGVVVEGVNDNPQTTLKHHEIGDFEGVYNMLLEAQAHLKFPSLRFIRSQDGFEFDFKMYLSGPKSKVPGQVNIVQMLKTPVDGKDNRWLGRVSMGGRWETYLAENDLLFNVTAGVLMDMAIDAVAAIEAYGKMSGRCAFCNSELTDHRSLAVGYGPVCADHYGLKEKWNAVAAKVAPEAAVA